MNLNDLSSTQKNKLDIISRRLSENFGYSFIKDLKDSRSLEEHISDTKRKMTIIENKTTFGSYQKNTEWNRLNLVLEGLMALKEKKAGVSNKGLRTIKEAQKASRAISESRSKFATLLESELERAELVMASRNIVDEIQDMVEDLSKIKIEKLASMVDRIKAEYGLDTAESFNSTVGGELDQALDMLASIKDAIDTEAHKLSGDVDPDAVTDMGGEDDLGDDLGDELDIGDDLAAEPAEPEFGEEELDLGEPEEVGRELKEGTLTQKEQTGGTDLKTAAQKAITRAKETGKKVNFKFNGQTYSVTGSDKASAIKLKESKITVQLETKSGKSGKKFFESKQDMRAWLNENENKIKTILKVTESKDKPKFKVLVGGAESIARTFSNKADADANAKEMRKKYKGTNKSVTVIED